MSTVAWAQLAAFLLVLLLLAWPLARVMHAVLDGRFTLGRCIEAPLYRAAGVHDDTEHDWLRYALGLLLFNGIGLLAAYALQRLQPWLPLNPQHFCAVSPDSAFDTAVSFAGECIDRLFSTATRRISSPSSRPTSAVP